MAWDDVEVDFDGGLGGYVDSALDDDLGGDMDSGLDSECGVYHS